jgi:hypothetical protein
MTALVVAVLLVAAPLAAAAPTNSAQPSLGRPLATLARALFSDMQRGDLTHARSLFFPEAAYVQLKADLEPARDFQYRILGNFTVDFAAYHALLTGRGPTTFLRVLANPYDERWIAPRTCYNALGYWYEPNIRLVYKQRGVVKSFAVHSLISWHGIFYVIHLGPDTTPHHVGSVALPRLGPGVAGPGGGC